MRARTLIPTLVFMALAPVIAYADTPDPFICMASFSGMPSIPNTPLIYPTAFKAGDSPTLQVLVHTVYPAIPSLTVGMSVFGLSATTTNNGQWNGYTLIYYPAYHYSFGPLTIPSGLSDGVKDIPLSAVGYLGATDATTTQILIDNTPPVVALSNITFSTTSPRAGDTLYLSGRADGTGSKLVYGGILSSLLDANGQTIGTWPHHRASYDSSLLISAASTTGTFTNLPYRLIEDEPGEIASADFFKIDFYMIDSAGNMSTTSSLTVPIPKTPPPDPCIATGTCVSNVLFLPGIEGSRLYEGTGCGKAAEEKLWDPIDSAWGVAFGAGDKKVRDLALDAAGESVCSDIYTKEGDVVDSVAGTNIYASLISQMNALKASGTMNDWKPVAYDWRLSFDDLLTKGTEHGNKVFYEEATSTPYIEQTLRALAANSKTGRVTIIAHSNGGLVTKALLSKLGDVETAKLVDKVIMVGVPQTGAPASVASLLVGYGAGLFADALSIKNAITIVSDQVARAFSQNSPMAYHLLPSQSYFDSVMNDPAHPVVSFSGDGYKKEEAAYGNAVGTVAELDDFLIAKDGGRVKPASSNLMSAEVLNPSLISYANREHRVIDAWLPPASVEVDQIAGWGVDTVAGIDFYTSPAISAVTALGPVREYRPIIVEDGDGTVPVPSAVAMASNANVKSYWIDLHSYNKLVSAKRTHADVFDVPSLEDFIKNLLQGSVGAPPTYISSSRPSSTNEKKLTYFLHSPLTLQLTDSSGNVTGLATDGSVTQDIPGSTYGEFGEVKYVTVPEGSPYQLVMHGLASGTFSLDMQERAADTVTASSTVAGVPTTASTTVTMNIQSDLSTLPPMLIDKNGDGTVDSIVRPKLNESAVFDTVPPELRITFDVAKKAIAITAIDDSGMVMLDATTTRPLSKKDRREEDERQRGSAVTTVTAHDEAGNSTVLTYTEQRETGEHHDSIALRSLAYNGKTAPLSAALSYEWEVNKQGSFTELASQMHVATSTLESKYQPKKNSTIIIMGTRVVKNDEREDGAGTTSTRQVLSGMVVPYIATRNGNLIMSY